MRVADDAGEVPINGAKRRALLSRLLVDPNRPVPSLTLIEDLWEGHPPASASATLHSHVSHLRRVLGSRLRTTPSGYLVEVGDDELDAVVFETEVAEARTLLAADPRRALVVLERAQARWRGPALADVAGSAWALAAAARLDELRIVATECDLEARLALGACGDVAARAQATVLAHPLRERLWALLITALYRDGRQAEALRAYSRLRRLLAEELGIDPSPELQALEAAVLAQDPALSGTTGYGITYVVVDRIGEAQAALAGPMLESAGGRIVDSAGGRVTAAFEAAGDAAVAALELRQRDALAIALHTDQAGTVGAPASPLERCEQLAAIVNPGQVVCTAVTARLLPEDLPVPVVDLGWHRLRDLLDPIAVYQLGVETFPPLRSLTKIPSNLPLVATPLIGREDDVDAVVADLREHRLVTLTGVGGVGKTRLALAAAAALAAELFDGAWLVELAPSGDGSDIATAAATALGCQCGPDVDPLSAVLAFLAERRLVLILDNCEHVLDAAAAFAEAVVTSSADVLVLATSREPLAVPGEAVRRVRSLEVPDEDVPVEDARDVPSVRLFVERARAADREFVLHEGNVTTVCTICRRLDGVPLALELAAARVRTMPVDEIARRLDDRFRVLTGARRAQERHRTLLATVAWSYDLLSPQEQAVFAQLSVFPSTIDLRAASAIVDVDGVGADGVVDLLLSLVDRSLVAYEPSSGRYRMLETLRQFAADRAAEAGDVDHTVARYVDHYLAFVDEVGPGVEDERHGAAVGALTAELDDIRATVDVLRRAERWEDLGRLALRGWAFFTQATPGETRQWLHEAVDHGAFADPQDQADAAAALALMAANVAAADECTAAAEQAVAIARAHDLPDPPVARFALSMLASVHKDVAAARLHGEAAVEAASARGDEFMRAIALGQLVVPLVRQGHLDEAQLLAEESLRTAVRLRNGTALTGALSCVCAAYVHGGVEEVGRVLLLLDRYADAVPWPSLGLNRSWLLTHRAFAEAHRDPRRAIGYGIDAARSADRISGFALGGALEGLAFACALADRHSEARALLSYVASLRVPSVDPAVRARLERELATAEDLDAAALPVPRDRRELLPLLTKLEQELDRAAMP